MRDGLVGWPSEFAQRYRQAGRWSGRALTATAATWGDPGKVAVIDGPTRITHRELLELTDGLAANLADRGLRGGDTVVVQLPNCWEFVVLTLACLRLGVAPLMALPAHRRHELQHLATLSGAVALAVPDSFRDFDHRKLGLDLVAQVPSLREAWVVGDPAHLDPDPAHPDTVDLRSLITPPADPEATRHRLDAAAPAGSDVAVFLLSGGTTGIPKIIPRTHDDYGYNTGRTSEISGTDASAVYLVALPAGHNFPLGCPGILGTLAAGGTVVMARSPEPRACLELIAEHGVTHTAVVPAVAQRWIDEAPGIDADLSSLRVLQVGGSRMPAEIARRVRPVLGTTLQQAFGMAEGLCNFTRLDDPDDVICETQGRPMSPDDEIRIVDEADDPVADGESGLLLTRGPYTLRGYFRAPEHNERAFTPDGWYRTGDVVHRHPSGNLVVDGRTKDVIVRGGEKISAEEVENLVYLGVPSVARVAAIGAPDSRLGERVAIVVVPRPGQVPTLEGVRGALNRLECAAFKLPEQLELVDALPLTPVGKIDKNRLRADLAQRLETPS
jgi:2,3-dihydroxybenzoate-AMP ligase